MTLQHGDSTSASGQALQRLGSRSHAVVLLQLFAITVMVIPSDTVIEPIGAQGYVASLVGMFAFAAFLGATLLGFHDPLRHRHPIRGVLCVVWIVVLLSYVLMDRASLGPAELKGADRLVMELAVITGVVLVAAEWLRSLEDVRRVLRALVWGGAVCGTVSALQFWLTLDLTPYLRAVPGFSLNFENAAIAARDSVNRVAGTAIHAIELGVVAGMLLPLAIYLAVHDTERSPRSRWAPVVLIGLAIPVSVSRSAIISVALGLAVLLALMPVRQRMAAICAAPFAAVAIFVSAHGVLGTLTSFFAAGSNESSVQARLVDYPLADRLVAQAPLFGHGPGTYLPPAGVDIFDNQYLKTAVELGLLGLLALAAYFIVPFVVALAARRRTSDPELRLLCAALAGAALAGIACSATFDSLSFPMFANVNALVIGLIGAVWRLAIGDEGVVTARMRAGPVGREVGAARPALATGKPSAMER